MSDFKLFAYRIPDKHFPAGKVINPFIARVVYTVKNGKAHIEEVAMSASCLDHVTGTAQMRLDIQEKLDALVANEHVNPTIMAALAPHI